MKIIQVLSVALAAASFAACGTSSTASESGTLVLQLTDAPFHGDSVSRVDLFVVRVDARIADTDSTTAARSATDDSVSVGGWTTVATPNALVELLAYRNGAFLAIGNRNLPTGNYQGFRLVIDPSRSSVTLKNGTVLTGVSTPNVSFPSASRSGIKIVLTEPVVITRDQTTTMLVDFDVNSSFVQRGATIVQNGLIFKPVVHASVR